MLDQGSNPGRLCGTAMLKDTKRENRRVSSREGAHILMQKGEKHAGRQDETNLQLIRSPAPQSKSMLLP